MEPKVDKPHCPNEKDNNKNIIKEILSEKEDDAAVRDKLYRMLYEASLVDEEHMDTDLIDECVKTIGMMEGDEQHIPEEKIQAMQQNIDRRYKEWHKAQHRRRLRKLSAQIAACLVLVLFATSFVANALGYNLIQMTVRWGKDTFDISIQSQLLEQESSDFEGTGNIAHSEIFNSIEKTFADIESKPSLPEWVPEGFAFKYAERFIRKDSTNVLLHYMDDANKIIIFDFTIFNGGNGAQLDAAFEKDDSPVQVYEKNGIKYYIMKNISQAQAVWSNLNITYSINGDITVEEMKKIIDSMYGG